MNTGNRSNAAPSMQDWLDALEHAGLRPKTQGRGFLAHCPAHDDSTPSLHVQAGDKVPVVVKCFAGCGFDKIKAALGLDDPNRPPSTRPPFTPKPAKPKKPQALPSGLNVTTYHYVTADGEPVLAVVRRATPTGKTFSQWRPVAGGQWVAESPMGLRPLYRLPDIVSSRDKVAIVEGEKCVDAVRHYWPGQIATTWPGGTDSWKLTDWQPLAGRAVSLLADCDEPGRLAMRALAAHLVDLDCTVKIGLPEGDSGDDIADWLAIDHNAARRRVAELLVDYDASVHHPDVQPDDDNADASASGINMRSNRHYRILGLVGDAVAIRISAGRILQRTRESLTQSATLIALAPLAWWSQLTNAETLSSNHGKKIGDTLIREADQLGQIDMAAIMGRGAARTSGGQVVFHLGDRLYSRGKETPLDDENNVWLAEPRIKLAKAATDQQLKNIARAVLAYRWATPEDGRRLMGWIVASIVGGALDWRPHLLMVAPAAQGKSWLLRHVVEKLMGQLLVRIADATPAALARLTAHSSLPIAIDEAEPSSPWVMELLKLLRVSAGAEGLRVRADGNTGGVVTQAPRFSALLSSTAAPQLQRADASRLSVVRFGPPVKNWQTVSGNIRAATAHAEAVRSRIIRSAGDIVREADKIAEELQGRGMDSREALATAALTAGWRFWRLDTQTVRAQPDTPLLSDAADALLDILGLPVRTEPHEVLSVLELLGVRDRAHLLADLYGIRKLDQGLAIAPGHSGLAAKLKRTPWEHVDLRRLLLQLDGARMSVNAVRFARLRKRAVLLPRSALEILGVETGDIFDTPTDTDGLDEGDEFDQSDLPMD